MDRAKLPTSPRFQVWRGRWSLCPIFSNSSRAVWGPMARSRELYAPPDFFSFFPPPPPGGGWGGRGQDPGNSTRHRIAPIVHPPPGGGGVQAARGDIRRGDDALGWYNSR